MLDCIKFILNEVVAFINMLFERDLGNGMNLGLLFVICFIFLPLACSFITLIMKLRR